ncbi:protein downstream neighbor of Son isoform X2 [Petromyzon marinus]|uniref:Protein downstream neighbor of Son isoform X2 n=1 Tax=Petromyzon marinus TaxID=7757 RepID=A0AAJ7U2W1_PETMA|nr:protein downstream neighbor of Son isoform X2 [Petromyzon marinus]
MEENVAYSPSFKRPPGTLKLKRRLSGAGFRQSLSSSGSPDASSSVPASSRSPAAPSAKRRNPFASLNNNALGRGLEPANKRASLAGAGGGVTGDEDLCEDLCKEPSRGDDDTGATRGGDVQCAAPRGTPASSRPAGGERLLDVLKGLGAGQQQQQKAKPGDGSPLEQGDATSQVEQDEAEQTRGCESGERLPPDWSVKTRILFTSSLPFSWVEHFKAVEEAQGLAFHQPSPAAQLPQHIQDPARNSALRSAFLRSTTHWVWPSFPWLPTFPRMGGDRYMAGKSAPWASDTGLQSVLLSEWSRSLSSLYTQLRSGLCPFFYVCAAQFSVLFRAAGLAGSDVVTAAMAPTTRGLREAMKREGIEFCMPLVEEMPERRGDDGEETCKEEQSEEDEQLMGGAEWLKEIGINEKFPKLDPAQIKLQRSEGIARLDHKAESLVLARGPDAFGLFNFLLGSRAVVNGSGVQTGLPPTLLAPLPFRGAALHTLRSRSGVVRTQHGTGLRERYSLELAGPILPHCLHEVSTLLGAAQGGDFCATISTHEPSAAFNSALAQPSPSSAPSQAGAECDLSGFNLLPATCSQLQIPPCLGKRAVREFSAEHHTYTWKL